MGGVDVIESLFLFRPWLMCRHPLTGKPAEVLERNNPIQIGDQSGPKVPAALRTNDQRLGALTDPLDMRDLHRVLQTVHRSPGLVKRNCSLWVTAVIGANLRAFKCYRYYVRVTLRVPVGGLLGLRSVRPPYRAYRT